MAPGDAFLIQLICNSLLSIALQVHGEDSSDDCRFCFVDDKVAIDKIEAVACAVGREVGVTAAVNSLRIGGVGIPEGFFVAVLQVVRLQSALSIEITHQSGNAIGISDPSV